MLNILKDNRYILQVQKTMLYSRVRQYFPMKDFLYKDDRDAINDADIVKIDWPKDVKMPYVGIVRDFALFPYWTKFTRFFDNNKIRYDIYNMHLNDWIESAKRFDIICGFLSSEQYHLEEFQNKYYFLEKYLGKRCFPRTEHAFLYENKMFEVYLSNLYDIPFANTYISHNKQDALEVINKIKYPIVSKIIPSSGSIGVEIVRTQKQAKRIIDQAFSRNGRKIHVNYFRQKNYIYFQEFIPNDGYDIRVMIVGNMAFGYFRKVLPGDFRASGMHTVEKRSLPKDAVINAWNLNKHIKSPLLVVDMVHTQDDKYPIIEYSPICQMETPEQLHDKGIPGAYIIEDDNNIHFEKCRYWVHELAVREYLINDYLPSCKNDI